MFPPDKFDDSGFRFVMMGHQTLVIDFQVMEENRHCLIHDAWIFQEQELSTIPTIVWTKRASNQRLREETYCVADVV